MKVGFSDGAHRPLIRWKKGYGQWQGQLHQSIERLLEQVRQHGSFCRVLPSSF
jgi:hypothetical protein